MGWVYDYCDACGSPRRHPTIVDYVIGEHLCLNCGDASPVDAQERREIVAELIARITDET